MHDLYGWPLAYLYLLLKMHPGYRSIYTLPSPFIYNFLVVCGPFLFVLGGNITYADCQTCLIESRPSCSLFSSFCSPNGQLLPISNFTFAISSLLSEVT
jgi:hypothetical protein